MRPDKDEYFLGVANVIKTRATCIRRSVGCILVDKMGQILSTGYNGVAHGIPHCNENVALKDLLGKPDSDINVLSREFYPHACPAAYAASGQQLDGCQAIHAEQNALLQCADVQAIDTCYVTASPCVTCTKLLMNTSCWRIIFIEEYAHIDAKLLWMDAPGDRAWIRRPQ